MPTGRFTGAEYPSLSRIAFALPDIPAEHVRRFVDALISVHEDLVERTTRHYQEYGAPIGMTYVVDPATTVDWAKEIVARIADEVFPEWASDRRRYEEAMARSREEWLARERARRVPARLRKAVFERDGYRCLKCGKQKDLCIDHVYPVVRGGQPIIDNLQTLCRSCNSRKCARVEPGREPTLPEEETGST